MPISVCNAQCKKRHPITSILLQAIIGQNNYSNIHVSRNAVIVRHMQAPSKHEPQLYYMATKTYSTLRLINFSDPSHQTGILSE